MQILNHVPVMLINPPAEVPRECYDKPNYPAIGIGYVAGYLKTNGIPVRVIDGKLSRLTVSQTIDQVLAGQPRILGITSMTHMIVTAHKIAQAIKRESPETTILLGGFHGSFLPERTLREFPAFDHICVGEGEIASLKFVTAALARRDPADIPGIASRVNGQVRVNGRGEIPEHLDQLGMPAWELFPRAEMYPIMSQRGCPFGCNFCSRPYGRKLRSRSPEHVVAELKRSLEKYHCKEINFYDETFTVRKEFVRNLCAEIVRSGLKGRLRLWAFVHANTIDLPTARAMRDAGFDGVGMGVESGNDQIIRNMDKGIGIADILRAGKILKQAGLTCSAYFIIGHPHETVPAVWDSIRLAIRLNPDMVAFGIMTPYPGTKVWDMATQGKGGYKMIAVSWEDFNKQIGNAIELETMSRKTMERLQLLAYLNFYVRTLKFRQLAKVLRKNYDRIPILLRKLISQNGNEGLVGSSSWLEDSAKPQIVGAGR